MRHVAIVAGGNVIAQSIAIVFSPIIARLYGPEAFGLYGVFKAMLTIGIPCVALGYAYAIVLPADDEDARRLLRLSVVLGTAVTLTGMGVLIPLRQYIAVGLGLGAFAPYLLWVPPAVCFGAMAAALDQWLTRKKAFPTISGVAIAHMLSINVGKAVVGLFAPGPLALIGIASGGQGLHALLAAFGAHRSLRQTAHRTPVASMQRLAGLFDERDRSLLRQYRDFPLYRLPQMLLNAVAYGLPTILLAALFGSMPAGLYAMAQRVIELPGGIIASAVGKVFQQRVAEAAHRGESLRGLIARATLALAGIVLIPSVLIAIVGPALFALVFGPEWRGAGEYARWLGLWLFFGFASRPGIAAIPLLSLQGHFLIYEGASVILRSAAILVGALVLRSDVAAVALFAMSGALLNFLLIVYVLYQGGRRSRTLGEACASKGPHGEG
jgi:O-antigen/teichoic acid export membrane protein